MDLQALLEKLSSRHRHLCPRQVLGVRIGLAGAAALGMEVPRRNKRMLVITETDGCFADGLAVATGCEMGHRTLRLADYGKIAAVFVDVRANTAVRVAPQLDIRQKAREYAPEEKKRYFAQLIGYQRMPDDELLAIQQVDLTAPIGDIISRAGVRVNCAVCGEEIINEREVVRDGQTLCLACAGPAYYKPHQPVVEWITADEHLPQ
ncbi:MAG TPA: formylmethanofuran dehydrogenase [Anaerolineae bacterium]|nr:formylmethanofuran dehydrogenase [Anaerolineae bacterium]